HFRPPLHKAPAECIGSLETDNQNRISRILNVVLQVMQDSAGLAHAARGNDHARSWTIVECNAFVDFLDIADALFAKQVGIFSQELPCFLVEALRMRAKDLRGPCCHWTIDVDRQVRQPAGIDELVQEVDDRLRASNSKSRDQQFAAALSGLP